MKINELSNAWEMLERISTEEVSEKETLYDIYYKISITLFNYRTKYNLSQSKLAEKLGVTQAMVSKLESGDYNYTVEQLWKVAKKLDFNFSIDFGEKVTQQIMSFTEENNLNYPNQDDQDLMGLAS